MSTFFSAIQYLTAMFLPTAGVQVLQPVKLPVVEGMVTYNKQ